MADEQQDPTMREIGRKGGKKRAEALGSDGMAELGRKGGNTTRDRYGREHYVAAGRRAGDAMKKKYGPDYYRIIGKKGAARVRELMERAKTEETDGSDRDPGAAA